MNRLIVILALLAGCAPIPPNAAQWRYTSDVGRQCFYQCQSMQARCAAYCPPEWAPNGAWAPVSNGTWACRASCNNALDSCWRGCPDLVEGHG